METPEFEWDDEKAVSNLKKHGVSFEEGATIFNDPMIATILDPDHSKGEERIRLISCRKATSGERKIYETD